MTADVSHDVRAINLAYHVTHQQMCPLSLYPIHRCVAPSGNKRRNRRLLCLTPAAPPLGSHQRNCPVASVSRHRRDTSHKAADVPSCRDNAVKRKKQGLVTFDGTQTSVSLEPQFWDALKEIARQKRTSATELVMQTCRRCRPLTRTSRPLRPSHRFPL
jgi:hypothetical protein